MTSNKLRLVGLLVALLVPGGALAGDSLETVEKKIEEKWAKVDSMTAKMKMNMNMKSPEPVKMDGTLEFLRHEGKEKLRMDSIYEQKTQGQEMKVMNTMIYDGQWVYALSEIMGNKMAMKRKPDVLQGTPGGSQMLATLKKDHDLKLLPDDKVDGQAVMVIEAKAKAPTPGGIAAYRMNFSKETGLLVKTNGLDEKGEIVMEIVYTDIKLNPKLDATRFAYKPEPGVELMDMTNQ